MSSRIAEYPARMRCRPLEQWPVGTPASRTHIAGSFRAKWASTLELLGRELAHLSADRWPAPSVLQLMVGESQIRQDGLPRADAIPRGPGVILSIESRHGSLSYPCDRYSSWQYNVRAIALSLEALRAVDRHGVSDTGQQYKGWQALPAGNGGTLPFDVDAATQIIREYSQTTMTEGSLSSAVRMAQAQTHPDRGGDRADWDRVEAAVRILRDHGLLT